MRRRRGKDSRPRAKRTVIPSFDPATLARETEDEAYTRILEGRVRLGSETIPRGMATTVVPPRTTVETPAPPRADTAEEVGRAMYGRYLASDFPAALALAERMLEEAPADTMATIVAQRCRERLGSENVAPFSPASVLRLRKSEFARTGQNIDATSSFVLGHIDGISDAATIAALTGLPRAEALDRLHALLDLGILEVVNG